MEDAGLKEVFRGDLPSVEMAGAILEDLGIATHRRFEFAGGLQLTANETSLVPGQTAVLLVPSIVYDEAKEALTGFEHADSAEYLTELTRDIESARRKRRGAAAMTLLIIFAPLAIAIILFLVVVIGSLFR